MWGAHGRGAPSLDAARRYAMEREQFGRPIAGFQLTEAETADMALGSSRGRLLALHLGRRKDAGTLRPEQVSLGKAQQHPRGAGDLPHGPHDLGRQRDLAGVPGHPA